MTPDHPKQEIIVKQQPPWFSIIALVLVAAFLFYYFKGCGGDKSPQIVYVKADSAVQEEARRWKDSANFYKQYKWQNQIMGEKLASTEQAIVELTRTIQTMETRIRRPIVVTDSVECRELVGMVNDYIDTAQVYRALRDTEKAQYEAWLASERGYSAGLRKYLDSCRSVVGVVKEVLPVLKPRNVLSLGVVGTYSPQQYGIGPAMMLTDKRGRSFQVAGFVTNGKPAYQGGVFVPLSFRRK